MLNYNCAFADKGLANHCTRAESDQRIGSSPAHNHVRSVGVQPPLAFGPHLPARAYVRDVITAIDKQWRSTGGQKHSHLHQRGEFMHNCYMFVSVYDGDHGDVVRIFVGLSCDPGRLIS